jgi:aldose 1-epimerase
MPDSDGVLEEINLGFSDLEGYEKKNRFYGSTVGRVANRIAKGRFTLNEKEYNLD